MKTQKSKAVGMKKMSTKVPVPPAGGDMAQAFERHMDKKMDWEGTHYDKNIPKSSKQMLGKSGKTC